MTQMGHEDQFPLRRLTARSVIRKRTVAATRGNGRDAPKAAVRGTEIEWARLPEANLPVSIPYRDIVELQATTARVGPDTPEAAFQRLAAVNSSVRTPARQVKRFTVAKDSWECDPELRNTCNKGMSDQTRSIFDRAKALNTPIRGPGPNRCAHDRYAEGTHASQTLVLPRSYLSLSRWHSFDHLCAAQF